MYIIKLHITAQSGLVILAILCHLRCMYVLYVRENSERNVDFLSIPQSGGKMSKRLGGIIDCKEGFPDDSTVTLIGSTVV